MSARAKRVSVPGEGATKYMHYGANPVPHTAEAAQASNGSQQGDGAEKTEAKEEAKEAGKAKANALTAQIETLQVGTWGH